MFRATLSVIAKQWEQPVCPSADEKTNKMWYLHHLPVIRNENIGACYHMDEP